jgi:hypothetical protein
MQPAQLSLPLLPDHAPQMPGLIAKASTLNATETGPAAMDPAGTQDRGDD